MSAAPARFTFDLDLAHAPRKNRVMPEDEFEQQLAQARQAGYQDGLRKGQSSAEARAAETLAQAAAQIAANATEMLAALDDTRRETLFEAVQLATSVGRKLAAHLIARQPQAELAALIHECMASLDHAPHLVVRCHPDLCDAMRTAAEERMRSSGFTGRLVVMGDPEIGLGDGRLEWVDGGLVRDVNTISAEINARISAYIAARGATPTKGD